MASRLLMDGLWRGNIMHKSLNICKTLVQQRKMMQMSFSNSKTNGVDNITLPPEPTNCCMSGCPNCVWVEYSEALAKIFNDGGKKAREIIFDKVTDPNMKAFLSTELRIIEMKQQAEKNPKNL